MTLKLGDIFSSAATLPPEFGPYTADLDENGVVVVFDKDENPVAWMPQELYLRIHDGEFGE